MTDRVREPQVPVVPEPCSSGPSALDAGALPAPVSAMAHLGTARWVPVA